MAEELLIKRIRVHGIVQGVGFRPTMVRLSNEAGTTGTVANKGSFVEIFAEGTENEISHFLELLRTKAPERSDILKVEVENVESSEDISSKVLGKDEKKLSELLEQDKKNYSDALGKNEKNFKNGNNVNDKRQDFVQRKYSDFRIIESEKVKAEIFISPDIAICDKCKEELFDKSNRRYLHPFINCNQCGPRFSILKALPYDRERTSMSVFPMCLSCKEEYFSPSSRRYDAQPVCCNNCGPEVYIIETSGGKDFADTGIQNFGKSDSENKRDLISNYSFEDFLEKRITCRGSEAITYARKILCLGGIVAIKGIGGFHLSCDATNKSAVERLRALKHRPMKPFAVMAKDENAADRECIISKNQRHEMTGHRKPIILMKKREGGLISDNVAPENPYVGLMLPYAPVQMLLFDYPDEWQEKMTDVLVMTSGNISGAPIASNDKEAVTELSNMCDAILSNNREIRIRTDDSVMDFYEDEPYMIRRSRGIAPLPFILDSPPNKEFTSDKNKEARFKNLHLMDSENTYDRLANSFSKNDVKKGALASNMLFLGNVLGIGGELKNTFCLGINNIFYPSAYVGDLADVRTVNALKSAIERTEKLLEMEPTIISCDLHPKYNSTIVAEELAEKYGLPIVRVQHHYAHVLSCMAENDYFDDVIGVSFDGTGFGTDGTIWGGEFLLSNLSGFDRKASIYPFLQIGGDKSSKEGWRIAESMIYSLFGYESLDIVMQLKLSDERTAKVQKTLFDRQINSIVSTSTGRLFDAVSAILGIRLESTFEGEASTALMYKAMEYEKNIGSDAELIEDKFLDVEKIKDKGTKNQLGNSDNTEASLGMNNAKCRDLLRTDLLIKKIIEEKLAGKGVSELAYYFHKALSEMIVTETVKISKEMGVKTAALTGGVFQNKLLLRLTEDGLKEAGIKVLRHHMVPPNDGGISLGQAVRAAVVLNG